MILIVPGFICFDSLDQHPIQAVKKLCKAAKWSEPLCLC